MAHSIRPCGIITLSIGAPSGYPHRLGDSLELAPSALSSASRADGSTPWKCHGTNTDSAYGADCWGSGEAAQGFGVGGVGHAALGENGANVAAGRDIEGRVRRGNIGRDPHSLNVRDLGGGALLDGNMLAIGYRKIKGGNRRGNVEGDVIFFGQHGNLIGADLIGGVAVRGDAVRSGNNGADLAGLQEVADHVVRDESEGNAAATEFPGGEPRALQIGAR